MSPEKISEYFFRAYFPQDFLTEAENVAETSGWVGEVVNADLVGHVVPVEVISKVRKPDRILRTQNVKVVSTKKNVKVVSKKTK